MLYPRLVEGMVHGAHPLSFFHLYLQRQAIITRFSNGEGLYNILNNFDENPSNGSYWFELSSRYMPSLFLFLSTQPGL